MRTHMSETARAFAPSTTAEELESLSGGKGPGQSNAAPVDAVTCGPIPSSRKAYVEIPLEGSDDGHRTTTVDRSEEHTSELQSRFDLVCRLLLEKKNSMHDL